jgi:hypothetical protein
MGASLADLAGVGRDVEVRGLKVTVTGVSARGLALLFKRFPELVGAVTGAGLSLASLTELGPDVLASVIAAGTGAPGDPQAEAVADGLSMSDQLALIDAILLESFGGDPEGFMQRLEKLAAGVGVQTSQAAA